MTILLTLKYYDKNNNFLVQNPIIALWTSKNMIGCRIGHFSNMLLVVVHHFYMLYLLQFLSGDVSHIFIKQVDNWQILKVKTNPLAFNIIYFFINVNTHNTKHVWDHFRLKVSSSVHVEDHCCTLCEYFLKIGSSSNNYFIKLLT